MTSLVAESWTWYGVTLLVVAARLASQLLFRGSIRKLKIDDFLMLIAMATDTVLIVAMNYVSRSNSNLIDPSHPASLSPEDISQRQFGSKMVLVVEQMQCATIWLVKACILLMYHRLTLSLNENLAVKAVACYAAFGFVVMEILYFAVWCRPFHEYWAVPPNNTQCSAATNHLITNAVFNLSSDLMIIAIPMPLFIRSTLALRKKLILIGVFALGGFTILSAILNKYYSFTEPFGSAWTFWYIRESSTAIIVANLPLTWNLFRRIFHLRSFHSGNYSKSRSEPPTNPHTAHGYRRTNADSEEEVAAEYGISLKIYQRHDVEIDSEPAPAQLRQPSHESLECTTSIRGGRPSTVDAEPAIPVKAFSSV